MVTATETPVAPVAVGVAKPKQKLSKNQLRRVKKRQQKLEGSSRESSVVSASESESESVGCARGFLSVKLVLWNEADPLRVRFFDLGV